MARARLLSAGSRDSGGGGGGELFEEAARAALTVAFDGVGLDEIWSMTAVLNEPSQAVMRRIGLTEVARFDHPCIPEGSPLRPHVTYHRRAPRAD